MARRSDHSREELYDLALAAACDIVRQHGYRGLTARKVGDAIGYSPGTLYNIFLNLDDLVMHVNGHTLDGLHDRFADVAATGDVEADLDALLDRYLGFIETNAALWTMLLNYSIGDDYEIPEWYSRKLERLMLAVEGALAPLFGPVPQEEISQGARILWASLHGIAALSKNGKLEVLSTQAERDMARLLVRNYVLGVRTRAGV